MTAQREGHGWNNGSIVKVLAIEGMRLDPGIHVQNQGWLCAPVILVLGGRDKRLSGPSWIRKPLLTKWSV